MNYEATHRCDEVRVICYYDNHRNKPHPGKEFFGYASGLDYSLAYFCYSEFAKSLGAYYFNFLMPSFTAFFLRYPSSEISNNVNRMYYHNYRLNR